MRLYKKAAAVLLAAVMAVSMLTACGSGGGSGSGGSSGSGSGGSGGTGGTGSGSGTGSSTEYSTDFDETTTGGTASKILENAQLISYFGSKTKNDFGNSYTMEYSANFGDLKDQTGNFEADLMMTTNGDRTYSGGTGSMTAEGVLISTSNAATLTDHKANKQWQIDLDKGTYTVSKVTEDSEADLAFSQEMLRNAKFYKGTYEGYDAEAFSVVATSEGMTMTMTFIYCYQGSTPKAMIVRGYAMGGLFDQEVMVMRIKSFSTKARTEFLDFENILSKYKPES